MKKEIDVYIKVDEGCRLPHYASDDAAGCDVYATCDMTIKPGEIKVMPLNFIIAVTNDIEIQIRPRSGLSLRTNIRIPNSPGTIDSDYRDMVGVIIENTYNIADLPYQIADNPKLLAEINEKYQWMTLSEYLEKFGNKDAGEAEAERFHKLMQNDSASQILDTSILVDKNGNPYGTIYIEKDDRIAQMIFSECKRANFILHDEPEKLGKNRGGGFGHSGVSIDE